jgi:hypothetical protein
MVDHPGTGKMLQHGPAVLDHAIVVFVLGKV